MGTFYVIGVIIATGLGINAFNCNRNGEQKESSKR